MESTWFIFEGKDGIDSVFGESKRHYGDMALVPFKTKIDKYLYEDFAGVVGAFSKILHDTAIKKELSRDALKEMMRNKMLNCSEREFDKFFQIVESIYFDNGKLLPINIKSLKHIESNITQQQVAEYLYHLFLDSTDLKEKYVQMEGAEDSNVLERFLFESLENNHKDVSLNTGFAVCFLPYIKDVFVQDFSVLVSDATLYQQYIQRFLAYYYMFYVSQLAVKLGKFENGKRDEIERIYMTLYGEVVTKLRAGYEYGWKYVKDKIGYMFSHSFLMEVLSHNIESVHMDYIGFYEKFNKTSIDNHIAAEVRVIREKYQQWIPMDYSLCKHDDSKDGDCETATEIKKLFETIDFQFVNGGRKGKYDDYNKKFINFVQKNFGKFRGMYGYTLSVHESDIIMFTRLILQENQGKIRLSKLFDELERRGLIFDRESRKRIVDLYEKMNLLEKRSDSGDAQYVKYIL